MEKARYMRGNERALHTPEPVRFGKRLGVGHVQPAKRVPALHGVRKRFGIHRVAAPHV